MATTKAEQTSSTDPVLEASERGFFGTVADPRPNEDYTVAGAIRRQGENLGGDTSPGQRPSVGIAADPTAGQQAPVADKPAARKD